jgi:hypothetical protein
MEWVFVNGARIERDFLEANIREAKSVPWLENTNPLCEDHVHCLICNTAITTIAHQQASVPRCYISTNGHLCEYCYNHYVVPGTDTR